MCIRDRSHTAPTGECKIMMAECLDGVQYAEEYFLREYLSYYHGNNTSSFSLTILTYNALPAKPFNSSRVCSSVIIGIISLDTVSCLIGQCRSVKLPENGAFPTSTKSAPKTTNETHSM